MTYEDWTYGNYDILKRFGLAVNSITQIEKKHQKTDPDARLAERARRNRVRGGNVRNLKNLGTADAKCGGGG